MNAIVTAGMFTGLVALAMLCLFAFAVSRYGSLRATIDHFKRYRPHNDWKYVLLICFFAVAGLAFLSAGAKADDWLNYTKVFVGMDYVEKSGVCVTDQQLDFITANAGIEQHIYGRPLPVGRLDVTVGWTHHSCAVDSDRHVYDGIGAKIEYTVNW